MGQKQLREFGSGISRGAKNRTIQHLSVFFSFSRTLQTSEFGIIEMALSFVNLRSYAMIIFYLSKKQGIATAQVTIIKKK